MQKTFDQFARDSTAHRILHDREVTIDCARRIEIRVNEDRDRAGYAGLPQTRIEFECWETAAAWPEE
jgi:hypothetical protein